MESNISRKQKRVSEQRHNSTTNQQRLANERLFSIAQICSIKNLPPATVSRLFSNQPDVVLLIPRSAAIRVFGEYGEEFDGETTEGIQTDQQEELHPRFFPIATKRGWLP